MVEKDKYLVVVSVLEGRKFPKRPRHHLIVEAKFDGELLATDPVGHVESPDFTQELAWELDKKALHQHRLQRTSIKVQCYALDPQSTMRECVGYVVLDLRSAQTQQQTAKWYPLLHTKYTKSRPDIKMSIYIDEDKGPDTNAFKAKEAPARPSKVTVQGPGVPEVDPRFLKPVLNDTEGFYQIGPEATCNESFMLSVTVSFATNLANLVPASVPLPANADGYFFYYSLFGNDVTNEPFHDLLNPSFQAERATVRLRSNVDVLRVFLSSQPGLEVHLCCGDQSLGSCDIALGSLLKQGSTEIYMKPVSIEGAFELHPPNRMKQQLPAIPADMKPSVGLSIVLRKEEQASRTPTKEPKTALNAEPSKSTPERAKEGPTSQTPPRQPKHTPPERLNQPKQQPRQPSPPPTHDGSYSDTFDTESHTDNHANSLEEEPKREASKPNAEQTRNSKKPESKQASLPVPSIPQATSLPPAHVMPVRNPPHHDDPSSSTTGPHIAVTPQHHHFCFSVDLRSVRDLNISHVAFIYLRYTYPFFGSAAPIMTNPPAEAGKGVEVLIPQSYCAFDFATSAQQLQDTFLRVPLMVEVWDRDKQRSQSSLLGTAQVALSSVFAADRARAVHTTGTSGWRQVHSQYVPVYPAEGEARKVGELHVTLSLEDWGPIAPQKVVVSNDNSQATTVSEQAAPSKPAPKAGMEEARQTQEYQAALELEMWKEMQEKTFQSQLKEKEMNHMRSLAEEWKRRDKERELLVKKRMAEYGQLEQQLKKTLLELEKRDRQLSSREQEISRLEVDLKKEHERKMTELREASRRMQEDCDHKVDLERNKIRELEDYIHKLKQQLSEGELKYQQLDREFCHYKEQQNTKPEVRLQSEINLLTLEKVELERKVTDLTKSKVHYKQQWSKALKELSRVKNREQATARAQLKRQQQEIEHMRLRFLAAEENEVVRSEKQELQDIKDQLTRLKEQESSKTQQQSGEGASMRPLEPEPGHPEEEFITRLIEERDSLLRTGVYTSEDHVIAEMDRKIREAMANRTR